MPSEDVKTATAILQSVKKAMNDKDTPQDISTEDLLKLAGTTINNYMAALSYTKTGTAIQLQREPKERNINPYNKDVLVAWQANHDIQYVVNAYAAVMYVASYVLKAEKGMSNLLKQSAKEGHEDGVKAQLKKLGSVFLTHREISAQEAAYRVLSLPLRQTSRKVVYINTSPKDKRISLLRPQDHLQQMEDDDEDVFASSIIDRYSARPPTLETICLASFAANYQKATATTKQPTIQLQNNLGQMYKRKQECILRWHSFNKVKETENFYRAKILLFLPWRDEDNLLANCNTYEDRYNEEEEILPNEQQYTYNEGEVNAAYQQLTEQGPPEDAWDALAPATTEENYEAALEGIEVLHNIAPQEMVTHLETVHRQAKNTNVPGSLLFMRQKNKDIMSFKDYKWCMRNLNTKQQEVVSYHRQWCKKVIVAHKHQTQVEPYQVFLTGPDGTGKSFVIKMLHYVTVTLLRHANVVSQNDIPIMLTASTGVAAFNINGVTIHSALSLNNRKKTNGENLPLSADRANTLQSQLENLRVLILDEVSMIGANTLSAIHHRLQEIKHMKFADTRFGNIAIIAVGDLYQLPPTKDKKIYETPGSKQNPSMEMLHGSLWQESFKLHELTEIVRQQDPQFIDILNNVRMGKPDDRLQQCVVTKDSPHYKTHALHVFGTNKKCELHNMTMLTGLQTTHYNIQAQDSKRDVSTQQVQMDVTNLKRSATGGLETNLTVAVDARVKLTTNIDVSDGLTNGARGKIVHIDTTTAQVHCILIEFENCSVGSQAKGCSAYKALFPNAVPIHKLSCTFPYSKGIQISRTQFPLTLCWASTIHSVQGLTVDEIVVNMSDMFDYAHAYVAFSRVKTIEGLQILDKYIPKKIKADPKVAKEMSRLQEQQLLIDESQVFASNSPNSLRICHLNVRNYLSNLEDIQQDESLSYSDIICFTETHFKSPVLINSTRKPIPNYNLFRFDRLHKGGVAVFTNPKYIVKLMHTSVTKQEHIALQLNITPSKTIVILTIYRAPTDDVYDFIADIHCILEEVNAKQQTTIVLGDVNEDLLLTSNPVIKTYMHNAGFQQKIKQPTTN